MSKEGQALIKRLRSAWTDVRDSIERIYPQSVIKPNNEWNLFHETVDGQRIDLRPIVLNLPWRRSAPTMDLFICLSGYISFIPSDEPDQWKSVSYLTRVGYFQILKNELHHVHGMHHDFDEGYLPGHPIFHSQMSSMMQFDELVRSNFQMQMSELDNGTFDHLEKVLGVVRIPSAQMDFFSVLTQVCADHLVNETVSEKDIEEFDKVRSATNFLIGAAHQFPSLGLEPAHSCYRSRHWYSLTPADP